MPHLSDYLAEFADRGEKPVIRLSPTLSNTVIPSGPMGGRTRTPNDDDPPPSANPPSDPPAPPAPPANPPSDPPAGDPPKWKNGEVFDPAKADEALTASRNEANRLKKERDALEAKIKAAEEAKLSEEEKKTKRIQEVEAENERLKTEARGQRIQLAVERTARALDFVSEEAALRFLDQDKVTFDDAGQPQNVSALLEQVLKDHPYLKQAATTQTPKPVGEHPPGGNQAGLTPEQAEQAQKATARAYAGTF